MPDECFRNVYYTFPVLEIQCPALTSSCTPEVLDFSSVVFEHSRDFAGRSPVVGLIHSWKVYNMRNE